MLGTAARAGVSIALSRFSSLLLTLAALSSDGVWIVSIALSRFPSLLRGAPLGALNNAQKFQSLSLAIPFIVAAVVAVAVQFGVGVSIALSRFPSLLRLPFALAHGFSPDFNRSLAIPFIVARCSGHGATLASHISIALSRFPSLLPREIVI